MSRKGLPLETKNTQNHENRSLFESFLKSADDTCCLKFDVKSIKDIGKMRQKVVPLTNDFIAPT